VTLKRICDAASSNATSRARSDGRLVGANAAALAKVLAKNPNGHTGRIAQIAAIPQRRGKGKIESKPPFED
jgi:hypothetical protein